METVLLRVRPDIARHFLDLPESDGKPIGETEFHIRAILELFQLLDAYFKNDENAYVGADRLFYYDVESPTEYIVPDVFFVKGVKKYVRRIYRMLDEQVAPCVVFEITSKTTYLEDLGKKRLLYETLGVREYFVFDPRSEYLNPQFQGYALGDTGYEPMPARADGTLFSRELGLFLKPTEHFIRPVDPKTNKLLPTYDELNAFVEQEMERAEYQAKRAEHAELEIGKLRAEIERLRNKESNEKPSRH